MPDAYDEHDSHLEQAEVEDPVFCFVHPLAEDVGLKFCLAGELRNFLRRELKTGREAYHDVALDLTDSIEFPLELLSVHVSVVKLPTFDALTGDETVYWFFLENQKLVLGVLPSDW